MADREQKARGEKAEPSEDPQAEGPSEESQRLRAAMHRRAAQRRSAQKENAEDPSSGHDPQAAVATGDAAKPGDAEAHAYQSRHGAQAAEFLELTGGSCRGPDGQLDAAQVRAWQSAHGLQADGKVGPETIAAARHGGVTAKPKQADSPLDTHTGASPESHGSRPEADAKDPGEKASDPVEAIRLQTAEVIKRSATAPTPRLEVHPGRFVEDVQTYVTRYNTELLRDRKTLEGYVEALRPICADPTLRESGAEHVRELHDFIQSIDKRLSSFPPLGVPVTVIEATGKRLSFSVESGGWGSLANDLRLSYEREKTYEKHSIEVLGVRIIGFGVAETAVSEAAAILLEVLGQKEEFQQKLKANAVRLLIVPHDRKGVDDHALTKGQEHESASGLYITDRDGFKTMVVMEQDLVRLNGLSEAILGSTTVHELGHAVQNDALPQDYKDRIASLYDKREDNAGPWINEHAAKSPQEYYATSVEAYFGRFAGHDRGWLVENDPAMVVLLDEIYSRKPGGKNAHP